MKNILIQQYLGALAVMISIILSLTVYAYASNLNEVKADVNVNTVSIELEVLDRKDAVDKLELELEKKVSAEQFKTYTDGIKTLLEYIQANDKEKRQLELKIIALTKSS